MAEQPLDYIPLLLLFFSPKTRAEKNEGHASNFLVLLGGRFGCCLKLECLSGCFAFQPSCTGARPGSAVVSGGPGREPSWESFRSALTVKHESLILS